MRGGRQDDFLKWLTRCRPVLQLRPPHTRALFRPSFSLHNARLVISSRRTRRLTPQTCQVSKSTPKDASPSTVQHTNAISFPSVPSLTKES
jgi:hypothetical protein